MSLIIFKLLLSFSFIVSAVHPGDVHVAHGASRTTVQPLDTTVPHP